MMFNNSQNKALEEDITKVLDDAVETLRWARLHYHEPRASESLRDLEGKLGYLALSLTWQEDGAKGESEQALGLAQGRSLREQEAMRRMWEEMWWSH